MTKRLSLLAWITVVALLAGGCVMRGRETESVSEISLPEPTEEAENMILGETLSNSLNEITLFFSSQDGTSFSTVTRSLLTEAGQSLTEAAVSALLSSSAERGLRPASDTQLLKCEYSCGTATVRLSIDARNVQNPQELLALEASIGNTLLGISDIQAVNVLVGDLSESCCQLPTGAQTELIPSVTGAYAQLQAEHDRLNQQDPEPIERTALLYFPTSGGNWLVPELRKISADADGFIPALIDALKAGPQQTQCAVPSVPEAVELLDPAPSIQTLSSGERMLDLNFSSSLANYLVVSGLDVWELAGSLSLTMCSFLPDLDAIRIMVNGDPITMCEMGENIMHFPGGLMYRRDFSQRIGSTATLYLADEGGMLHPVERAVSMRSALSPRSLLEELIQCQSTDTQEPAFPLPEGIHSQDILGIQTSGGIARVNLSANFYRNCQILPPLQERALIYCMVNTLCELTGIRSVRFYVEGRAADTLAGSIYLKSALIPNPGIVVVPSSGGPEEPSPTQLASQIA